MELEVYILGVNAIPFLKIQNTWFYMKNSIYNVIDF